MDVDTRLVHAGSTPTEQSNEEPERAELMTLEDYLDNDNRLVLAGSCPTHHQSDEALERVDPMAMDRFEDDTPLVRTGSSPTEQSDEELDRTELRLRLELLANIYASEPVQLKDFEPPPECFQCPDQQSSDAIFSAYIAHTVFHVKVWINFDARENVFFEGARSAGCGKLQLPEGLYETLAEAVPAYFSYQHVCFEIGTPFRTLALVDLNIEDGADGATLQVDSELVRGHDEKVGLEKYIQHCCRWIKHNGPRGLAHDIAGLRFQDLEAFASLFCRDREVSPGRDEYWEEPQYGGGEWAGVEDPYKDEWSTTWYDW